MKWPRSVTRPRLSKLALAVALLAGAKLVLLLSMEFTLPGAVKHSPPVAAPSVQVSQLPQASVTAQAGRDGHSTLTAAMAIPDKAPAPVSTVKASILEDSVALAQQPPAKAPAPKPQAQPESVLTIQQIRERADALDRQEKALKTLESDLNARLAKLQELETMLKGMLAEAKSVKEEKLKHLIDVYTNMKSKQAASVLETLDENIAVKILAGMKGRQAGEILTYVTAKKAAKLSEMLTKLQVGPDLPAQP